MADFNVTTDFSSGTSAVSSEVNKNFEDVEDVFNGDNDSYDPVPSIVPIGSIVAWAKTFGTADSGTTDSTTADKLVDSTQNFLTTIKVGMIVHNTTDDTFANVTAVDSDTTLSLDSDIMVSGENYIIYKTPQLADGWMECNGGSVSDADSPYDGETIPDLNASSGTARFLRGKISSGSTGGSETHAHSNSTTSYQDSGDGGNPARYPLSGSNESTGSTSTLPSYYEVVWIMRIK